MAHEYDPIYVIGDVEFSSYYDAEAWAEAGNISGTYTIERLDWCEVCEEHGKIEWDEYKDREVCQMCYRRTVVWQEIEAFRLPYLDARRRDKEWRDGWIAGTLLDKSYFDWHVKIGEQERDLEDHNERTQFLADGFADVPITPMEQLYGTWTY